MYTPVEIQGKTFKGSGMGYSIMESFTDSLSVSSKVGKGTSVTMKKYIGKGAKDEQSI